MSGFKKNDVKEGKPDWSLFPFDGAEGIVRIMEMGARKYDRDNWRQGLNDPDAQRRIFSAIIRHLTALQRGETLDPESGEHHILHAATNALFLASFAETRRRNSEEVALESDPEPEYPDEAYVCESCGDPECGCCDCPDCREANDSKDTIEDCDDPDCEACY